MGRLACYVTRFGNVVHFQDDRCIGLSLREYGEWAPGETALLSQLIQPRDVIVDVGANIGFHTLFFAQHTGEQGKVIALEPQASIHRILGLNISLNGLHQAEALHCLVGAESRIVKSGLLKVKPGNYGAASYDLEQQGAGAITPVMQIKLDDLDLSRCDLIKIDVEGMELSVLAGTENILSRCKPIVFYEQNSRNHYTEIQSVLRRLNYACYWSVTPAFPRFNLYGKKEDLFRGSHETNILAIPQDRIAGYPFLEQLKPVNPEVYSPPKLSALDDTYAIKGPDIKELQVQHSRALNTIFTAVG